MSWVKRILDVVRGSRGVIFIFLLLLTASLGTILILFWMLPFAVIRPKFWRQFADRMVGWWLIFPVVASRFLCMARARIKIMLVLSVVCVISAAGLGRVLEIRTVKTTSNLVWKYTLVPVAGTNVKSLFTWKVLLMYVGWAMQCASFIFLKRRLENDKDMISDTLDYYKDMGYPYQILLFPEGTDLTGKTKEGSLKFARENNLPEYQFVLHPRTTGFAFIVNKMRTINYIEHIYDITVSYKDRIVQDESQFLAGRCPEEVCFHVNRFDVQELPDDEGGLSKFCQDLWTEKEEALKHFYNSPPTTRDLLRAFQEVREKKRLDTNLHKWPVPYSGRQKLGIWINFFYCFGSTMIWGYFFVMLASMRLCVGVAVVGYLLILWKYDGVESMVLSWRKNKHENQKEGLGLTVMHGI